MKRLSNGFASKSSSLVLILLLLFAQFMFFPNQVVESNTSFKGRIAISTDGNYHDTDDIIATALTIIILAKAHISDKVVHYDHSNHIWDTSDEREQIMEDSVLVTADMFPGAYPNMRVYCSAQQTTEAVQSLLDEINASSEEDPLTIICGGPMEIVGLAVAESEEEKRQYVTLVSHSKWNDNHAHNNHDGYSYDEVIDMGINGCHIKDQNGSAYFLKGDLENYYWMRDHWNPEANWIWERNTYLHKGDTFDGSDAGMAYYVAHDSEYIDEDKLKALFEYEGTGSSPTPIPTDTPTPSPTPLPTSTPSPTPEPEPSEIPVPTVIPTPSPDPTIIPENTPTPAPDPTSTPEYTPTPSPEIGYGIEIKLYINSPNMTVNGKQVEIDPGRGTVPVIVSDRTLLPVRAIIEAIGGTIDWNDSEKKVSINVDDQLIEMWMTNPVYKEVPVYPKGNIGVHAGSETMQVNGQQVLNDVPPMIINDRTFMPLRFIAENAGCEVTWDGELKMVEIFKEKQLTF